MEERQFSLGEVAELLNISERTARRWIKSGKLRAYKPGRDYRIPERALRELAEASEVRPKARASLSQDRLFNGAREREAFIERVRQYIDARVAHYQRRLTETEGGPLAGYEGATRLSDDALDEFMDLPDLINGELAERWMLNPEVPEVVKEDLGRAVGEVMRPLVEIVGRIGGREKELAETEAQRVEAERRREQIREQTRKISA
jgi:excisionase family DNA binding protein